MQRDRNKLTGESLRITVVSVPYFENTPRLGFNDKPLS